MLKPIALALAVSATLAGFACNRNDPGSTDDANQHGGPTHADSATAPAAGINADAAPQATSGIATIENAAAGIGGMPVGGTGPSGGTGPTGGTRHGHGGTAIR